jgi:hypothetical protein
MVSEIKAIQPEIGHKFHQIENYLIFWTGLEQDLSQLKQNLSIFNPKNYYQAIRNISWFWDLEKLIPDPVPVHPPTPPSNSTQVGSFVRAYLT